MKKIFKYLGVLMSAALLALTACTPKEEYESADVGLNIKAFFPTKVVTGQPMTINGSGFKDVKEIVFPDGISVTNFEHVGNDMIRVNAPSGIKAEGGPIKVRTDEEEVESRVSLTVGNTVVSGFSKQDGEEINGGEQLSIFGTDLEFISSVELLDTDGNPLILEDEDFYRKGTSQVTINIPKKTIYDGSFVGYIHTIDGKVFPLPELTYIPASDGGHWETVETVIWENATGEVVDWGNVNYRFGLDGHDGNNECDATFPQDVWDKIKSETFYLLLEGANPQIRITTGWWSVNLTAEDIQPGNELLADNGDGTWTLTVDLTANPDLVALLDDQHLLFTGGGFTPLKLYFSEDIWIDGGGHSEIVKTSIWKNATSEVVDWGNVNYRFGLDGHDGNNECDATFPQDVWDKIKTETFYLLLEGANPQIRVTTGWWSVNLTADDIQPGNELLADNGDGTWTLTVDLTANPDLVALLDDQHLLFTGGGFIPLELYFEEEIWVDGGDSGPKETVFWENATSEVVDWGNVNYRFGLDGHDGNNECDATFPQDIWDKIKSKTFYLLLEGANPQIRVTTGWWSVNLTTDDFMPGNELLADNGDGTWTLTVDLTANPDLVALLDDQHLLFTGGGFTPLKLYFFE
ncbi:MAG: hypothetical protein II874_04885 [Bacteroidales bacterium]|nr:hypothetical protein [Bacteroidales bacterium]